MVSASFDASADSNGTGKATESPSDSPKDHDISWAETPRPTTSSQLAAARWDPRAKGDATVTGPSFAATSDGKRWGSRGRWPRQILTSKVLRADLFLPVLGTEPNTLRSSTGAPCSRVPSKQICLPGTGKLKWAECITAPLPAMIDSSLQASTIAVGATLPPASK